MPDDPAAEDLGRRLGGLAPQVEVGAARRSFAGVRARRRRTRRIAIAGAAVFVVLAAGFGLLAVRDEDGPLDVAAGGWTTDDGEAGPGGIDAGTALDATVVVPDLRRLRLEAADAALASAGLVAAVADGDPAAAAPASAHGDRPEPVVVAQEPPAGTALARGATVGLRTALVSAALCDALRLLPVTADGDARAAVTTPGAADALRAAAAHAFEPLRDDITAVLAAIDAGDDLAAAPGFVQRGVDRIAVHVRACPP